MWLRYWLSRLLDRLLRHLILRVHFIILVSFAFLWRKLLDDRNLVKNLSSSLFWWSYWIYWLIELLVNIQPQFFLLFVHKWLDNRFVFHLSQLLIYKDGLLEANSLGLLTGALWILNRIVIFCDYVFDLLFWHEGEMFCHKLIRIFWLQIHQFMTRSERCLVLKIILIPLDLILNLNMIVRHHIWLVLSCHIEFKVWSMILSLNLWKLRRVHQILGWRGIELRKDERWIDVEVFSHFVWPVESKWDLKACSWHVCDYIFV